MQGRAPKTEQPIEGTPTGTRLLRATVRSTSPTIEIVPLDTWQPVPKIPEAREWSRGWTRALGVLGALLVHAIAFDTIGWGTAPHKSHEMHGIGSAQADAHAEASDELVLLNLDSAEKGVSVSAIPIASVATRVAKTRIELAPLDPLPIADPSGSNGSSNPAESGDPSEKALMVGRYRSQISARIDRAWVRPRTPVNDLSAEALSEKAPAETPFVCQAQIRQDARGNVQEVLLLACNGTEVWQHSLVVAINQSSPLPAPPIPAVFASNVTLTLVAHAYQAGDPTDEYERVTREAVSNTLPVRSAGQIFGDASRSSQSIR